jgi:hypothetical protein
LFLFGAMVYLKLNDKWRLFKCMISSNKYNT